MPIPNEDAVITYLTRLNLSNINPDGTLKRNARGFFMSGHHYTFDMLFGQCENALLIRQTFNPAIAERQRRKEQHDSARGTPD